VTSFVQRLGRWVFVLLRSEVDALLQVRCIRDTKERSELVPRMRFHVLERLFFTYLTCFAR